MNSSEELGKQIEALIRDYVEAGQREVQAALGRAFTGEAVAKSSTGTKRRCRVPGDRRSPQQVVELGEKLYAAIVEKPGETMAVLAVGVGASARELHRPMTVLRRQERIRSVGQRQRTRYYPTAS